jgi:predicted DNA-binding transcriptional regulator YafY
MPKENKTVKRYQLILDIFRRYQGSSSVIKLADLAKRVGVSVRQLGDDLKYMKGNGAPIEYNASKRGWGYGCGVSAGFTCP